MSRGNDIVLGGAGKRYGARAALEGVDLRVEPGERVALIGHNGAGKTTLMKLVLGLTRPDSGSVRVCGVDPGARGSRELRRRLGYLPENVAFQGGISGRASLRFYARLKRADVSRCDALLEEVGLADAMHRPVRTYSKGMRQRLGLAQALLGSPAVLVLDEPTTGLDPVLRHEFYTRLDGLHTSGATMLLSSHSLAEIETRSDRIAVLRGGRLVALGTLDELRARAGVPVRIRLRVERGAAPRIAEMLDSPTALAHVNGCEIDLACPTGQKMPLLRRVADAGLAVHDVEVIAPPLDEVYRFFSEGEEQR
ncbi:MAG: ABC transporter ATP-binding protein [Ectothiorhodospiraceae bacterium]|nr:ABC transporter ATP-binding protein [Chromatiales bacterium]MCP5153616.1 ABC transporter ATP-binding protein [Ectothiorhodospiraceae bacterium]